MTRCGRLRPGTAFGQTARARAEWISLDGKPVASGIFSTPDGRIRSSQAPAIRLLRTTVVVPRGTILLFPDCGDGIPTACHDGMPTAEFLNQCGFDAAILKYRTNGGSDIRDLTLGDAIQAWRLILAKPQAFGLHGGRFGIMGYSGCRTENTLWNLRNGELDGQSPKVVTLMIGTNNVDEKNYPTRHTAGQLAGGIQAIIGEIRQKCPGAKILLLRPIPGSYDGTAPTSHRMILERAGDLLKALADNERIFYLDVNAVFLNPDGSINQNLMPDCLHPRPEGTRRWAEAMEPLLSKLMGDPLGDSARR